jgi:hypothetical protein
LRSGKRVSQEGNEQAASIILSDPRRYDGLPLIWARLWVERGLESKQKAVAVIGPGPKSPQGGTG